MAGLSEEEFHRYQQVLLELKSSKYQLEDEKRQLLAKVHMLENTLTKKEEVISRSKKSREFEQLANDNDALRQKMFAQGEEFRMQSETLMKEYSTLVIENEKLTNQLEAYRGGCAGDVTPTDSDCQTPSDGGQDRVSDRDKSFKQEIRELCKAKQSLEEEKALLEKELNKLSTEHGSAVSELSKLREAKQDLEIQNADLKQNLLTKETLHTKDLENIVAKHQKTVEELEESSTIRMEQIRNEHADVLTKLKEKHQGEMTSLRSEFEAEIAALKTTHDSQLSQLRSEMEELSEKHQNELAEVIRQRDEQLSEIRDSHSSELAKKDETLEQKENEAEKVAADLRSEIEEWKQKLEDMKNSIKIQEKKNTNGMRDLKKQLIAEARRADELQRRLEEVMVDATSRQSLEELFRPPMSNRLIDDGGSLRSWNASNSGVGTDNGNAMVGNNSSGSGANSAAGGVQPGGSLFGFTNEDVRLMIQRLTETQQENCMLKEKIAHVEETNACLADDLRHKSAIIERYVSSSHINAVTSSPMKQQVPTSTSVTSSSSANGGVARDLERISSAMKSRFGELLKSDSENTNKSVQKNLQRLLEETLTKNIHLEESLLLLTTELETTKERLNKLSLSEKT